MSGGLLAASQPNGNLWPLAWFGLVPLLLVVRGARPRRAFALGWFAAILYFAAVFYWIAPTITTYTRITPPVAIAILVLLAAVVALFWGACCALLEWFAEAGISRVLSLPAIWVVVEWLRTFFPAAFPWGFLGYSQFAALPVIQIADIAGVYGVTAVLAFSNAALAEFRSNGVSRHRTLAVVFAALLVAVPAYGFLRLAQVRALEPDGSVKVGVVQANIAQDEKWHPGLAVQILDTYLTMSREAVAGGAEIVLWPEAAVPFYLELDPNGRRMVTDFVAETGVPMLVGSPGRADRDGNGVRSYNQAWLVEPDGRLEGPYDKIRLVPFGEYVPFGPLLSWVDKAVEGVGDFGFGRDFVVFEGPDLERGGGETSPLRASALICYEGIFPALTRKFVAGGSELLVNISNDAWYGRTAAPYQLLGMIATRAVENRVPLIRATNTGVSAVVDVDGSVRNETRLFEPAVFVEEVALVRGSSLYALTGDLFVHALVALLFLLAGIRIRLGAVLIPDRPRGILGR
jgi:apolipoprotein N-acyltransferase